jgi:hypothetical protein
MDGWYAYNDYKYMGGTMSNPIAAGGNRCQGLLQRSTQLNASALAGESFHRYQFRRIWRMKQRRRE